MQSRRKSINGKVKRKKKLFSILLAVLLVILLSAAVYVAAARPFEKHTVKKVTPVSSQTSKSVASSSQSPQAKAWLQTAGKPSQLGVLMFHWFSPTPSNSNYMSPANLEGILQALNTNGYQALSSNDAVSVLSSDTKPSNKMVWLTFDDGHEDFYQYVYPLLKQYNIHATLNMVTGTLPTYGGTDQAYVTLDQMKEMAASGLVDFQSHTVNHLSLTSLSSTDLNFQLQSAKQTLDSDLNQNTQVIVYPSGQYNQAVEDQAKQLGYKLGLTTEDAVAQGGGDLLAMPRLRMSTTTTAQNVLSLLDPTTSYNTANTK